jgi:hypothetical protein
VIISFKIGGSGDKSRVTVTPSGVLPKSTAKRQNPVAQKNKANCSFGRFAAFSALPLGGWRRRDAHRSADCLVKVIGFSGFKNFATGIFIPRFRLTDTLDFGKLIGHSSPSPSPRAEIRLPMCISIVSPRSLEERSK